MPKILFLILFLIFRLLLFLLLLLPLCRLPRTDFQPGQEHGTDVVDASLCTAPIE